MYFFCIFLFRYKLHSVVGPLRVQLADVLPGRAPLYVYPGELAMPRLPLIATLRTSVTTLLSCLLLRLLYMESQRMLPSVSAPRAQHNVSMRFIQGAACVSSSFFFIAVSTPLSEHMPPEFSVLLLDWVVSDILALTHEYSCPHLWVEIGILPFRQMPRSGIAGNGVRAFQLR